MAIIPNKLQKERTIEGKCKYVHKYLRFSRDNKTYRTDVYYCILCGHKVKIEEIVGKYTKCWKCDKPFTIPIGMFKLRPTCPDCNNKKRYAKPLDTHSLDFLEDNKESVSVGDQIDDLLREVGLK